MREKEYKTIAYWGKAKKKEVKKLAKAISQMKVDGWKHAESMSIGDCHFATYSRKVRAGCCVINDKEIQRAHASIGVDKASPEPDQGALVPHPNHYWMEEQIRAKLLELGIIAEGSTAFVANERARQEIAETFGIRTFSLKLLQAVPDIPSLIDLVNLMPKLYPPAVETCHWERRWIREVLEETGYVTGDKIVEGEEKFPAYARAVAAMGVDNGYYTSWTDWKEIDSVPYLVNYVKTLNKTKPHRPKWHLSSIKGKVHAIYKENVAFEPSPAIPVVDSNTPLPYEADTHRADIRIAIESAFGIKFPHGWWSRMRNLGDVSATVNKWLNPPHHDTIHDYVSKALPLQLEDVTWRFGVDVTTWSRDSLIVTDIVKFICNTLDVDVPEGYGE